MKNFKNYMLTKIVNSKLMESPFKHFEIDDLLPEPLYKEFINTLPKLENYEPLMHQQTLIDGKPTRFELALPNDFNKIKEIFNNYSLVHELVDAFCSVEFKSALLQKFGVNFDVIPYPHLYRDLSGFELPPHTDIIEKAITLGWYLPADESYPDSGLGLFTKNDGAFIRTKIIEYKPNKAFAFLRSSNSWHGANHKISDSYERNSLFITFYHEKASRNGKLIINDPNVERKEIELY